MEVPIAKVNSALWPGFIVSKSKDAELYTKFVDSYTTLWESSHEPDFNLEIDDCPHDRMGT